MRENDELARDIERGHNAKSVLNDFEFKEAFIRIKATLINGFTASKFDESTQRDEIWRKLQCLEWLEEELTSVIENGKMSDSELEQRNLKQ